LNNNLKGWFAKTIFHYTRLWDLRTANGVDHFLANSNYIARRIAKIYRRDAEVIYPPVDIDIFSMSSQKEDFYLTASRMVTYKKMDLIVEAFAAMPHKKLVVIGDGPDYQKIKQKAGKNVEILGYQPSDVLKYYLQRAKAFVFAAEEDFGITPVEAQACGTPVIAYGKGGACETVRGLEEDSPTGVFFYQQDIKSLCEAINLFEEKQKIIHPDNCRKNAERFSVENFRTSFQHFVNKYISEKS
jgi:glycosyltransferase involved in cell wall biosynthesis